MNILKLVIPIDFSKSTINALHYAKDLTRNKEDELILVHVLNDMSETEVQNKLKNIVENELSGFEGIVKTKVITGDIKTHVGSYAENIDANFVIMGIHENSFLDSLLGSKALDVISDSKTPFIAVQQDTAYSAINKIAMTIDLDQDSVQVVKAAAALAHNMNSELILVAGIYTDPEFKKRVQVNLKVATNYLDSQDIKASIKHLERSDFINEFIDLCEKEDVNMISATYYLKTLSIFSPKFVQHLMSNKLGLPVLTVDAQIFSFGPQFPFITT
jgi:K+-sensing histidine kinase KdpD